MAQVKLNENGDFINAQTGKVIGNARSGLSFSSAGSELKSLQEMGVQLPDLEEAQKNDLEDDDDDEIVKDKNIALSSKDVLKEKQSLPKFNKYKKSKYHVTNDSYFIVKFGLLQQEDGRYVPITYESTDEFPKSEKHWVKFRMWYYNEQLQWKQSVMEYSTKAKMQILNQDKLNEIKLKKLLLDWSFESFDKNLALLHCDGKLSDESYEMFMGLHPSIAKTIVDLMNLVLENNQ